MGKGADRAPLTASALGVGVGEEATSYKPGHSPVAGGGPTTPDHVGPILKPQQSPSGRKGRLRSNQETQDRKGGRLQRNLTSPGTSTSY